MNPAHSSALAEAQSQQADTKVRHAVIGAEPDVLTQIYQEQINMAVWQRNLPHTLTSAVHQFLAALPSFQASLTVVPERAHRSVSEALGEHADPILVEHICELVDMFGCLFELKRVGLRMTVLSSAMCPKFHVDRVPCRLISTLDGVATEWLEHAVVDRSKLGAGSAGKSDSESGLYGRNSDIKRLRCGDVALLKGEAWEGNEYAGLVHRSPALPNNERRFVLTLDFS